MTTQDDGGPAFPIVHQGRVSAFTIAEGMSLRDWFAAMALQGLCANPVNADRHRVELADMAWA